MAENSKIAWTDNTWNPWRGCRKVSPGCKNCYMYRDQTRYGKDPKAIIRAAKGTFNMPLKWQEPKLVFTCSWSDWFIEQADQWREEAWSIVRATPHTYQVLTKRPENIPDRLPVDWGEGYSNVWLGVSVENQNYLYRAELLAKIKAAVRFISYEPALGPVDFSPVLSDYQWLIVGGESGANHRPMEIEWVESIVHQCKSAGVPVFVKQDSGLYPGRQGRIPDELFIREFPG